MKNRFFSIRLINFLLILVLILGYQMIALDRARAEDAAQRQQLEEQLKAAAAAQSSVNQPGQAGDGTGSGQGSDAAAGGSQDSASPYKDGEYTGTAEGFGGDVTMKVTIKGGVIEAIDVVSASGEDAAYWDMAQAMIPNIIAAQDPNVDTVSGATFSSTGIKNAVISALQQAVK